MGLSGETGPRRLTVLAIYPWPGFWSMGEGKGASPFFFSITSYPRHGHSLHVLMPGSGGRAREEDYHGVALHRFQTAVDFMPEAGRSKVVQHARLLTSYLYWRVRALREARRLADEIVPDAVVGMGALGAPIARSIGLKRGIPNITRLFGTSLGCVMGDPLRYALRYREIRAFRTPADALVVCDDGSGGNEIAEALGADMSRFVFLPDGIDKNRFLGAPEPAQARERLGLPGNGRVVLSVSRFHREKNVASLIRAVPDVLSDGRDVTFLLVGKGPEEGRLKELVRDLGVSEHVVFTGALEWSGMPLVYAAADVFVTLSERTNVLNPLHEAMISGLPVVALNTGRTAEVVDGRTGILLERRDLPALSGVLLDLLGDDGRRRSLGDAARESADSRLPTIEERQRMEIDVVERAVEERRRTPGQGGARV